MGFLSGSSFIFLPHQCLIKQGHASYIMSYIVSKTSNALQVHLYRSRRLTVSVGVVRSETGITLRCHRVMGVSLRTLYVGNDNIKNTWTRECP